MHVLERQSIAFVHDMVSNLHERDGFVDDEVEAFAARLKVEVNRAGGRKAFAEKAEIPLSTLNSYLAGVEPKVTMVVRIARALGVTVADLLERPDQNDRSSSRTFDDSVQVRLLNVVGSAGPGVEIERPAEPALKALPFSKEVLGELGVSPAHARFIFARGDSMEPTISDGALVLLDTSHTRAKDDGVYAVVVGNDVRIKRLARGWDNAIVLLSDNERYPSETLAAPDAESLRIAGKVVWAGGKL